MPDLSAIAPSAKAAGITPSDSADIEATRGVYTGISGDLKVDMLDGTTITFANLAAGIVHPLQVRRIYATGTTAGDIIALY